MWIPAHRHFLQRYQAGRKGERESRIQIHATINLFEFHTVMQRERCTPIELLDKIGFLDPQVSLSTVSSSAAIAGSPIPTGTI